MMMTVSHNKFLFNITNRHTNFPSLFLSGNSTCFRQFLCPSSGVFQCVFGTGICHAGLMAAVKRDQEGTFWSCLTAAIKPAWHIPVPNVQWKTPDDGQRNCLKHVEFFDKNKFGKLVHLLVLLKRSFIVLHSLYIQQLYVNDNCCWTSKPWRERQHVPFSVCAWLTYCSTSSQKTGVPLYTTTETP